MPAQRRGFEEEYPFTSRWLNLDGLQYHYVDEGQGQVLLCVHGNPTWSFAWRRIIKGLSRDHRVLAVDHVGCGFSSKPAAYNYRLATHIANLEKFITTLDLRGVTLLVHDWGGPIGLGAALRCLERFERFAICNTAAFRSTMIPWRIAVCRWPVVGPLAVRGLNLFARAALRMAVCRPERITPAVRAGYLAPYGSWADRVAVLRFVQDIPLARRHPSFQTLLDIEGRLPRLAAFPVLLAWGMRDWCFTPEFLEQFLKRLPHAQALKLAQAGHYLFEDAHDELIAALREFLRAEAGAKNRP